MEENNITSQASQTASSAVLIDMSKSAEVLILKLRDFSKKTNLLLNAFVEKIKTSFKKADTASSPIGYSERPAFTPNRKKKLLRIYMVIAVALLIGGAFLVGRISKTGNTNPTYADSRPLGPSVSAQEKINKDFSFPLLDEKGAKISTIKYKMTTADLEDSIIVNGQKATAVKGRTFLVINLEITNNHTQGIQINSKDYIRLRVNNQGDWIAPDIHNDPVTVQAISTKLTRLGFPINDTDKDLTLQVGEITGNKELIKLDLQRK